MSVRATVISQFEKAAIEQKIELPSLADDLNLLDSGLNSLSFAMIVLRMEELMGFDPFDSAEEVQVPATFGEFVALYEKAPG
jgi:hypothetical protein